MSSQSTYRRWRSRDFSELVGQDHVTRTLLNALRTDRVHHAYLFCGPRGTGKTSSARILAKAINCLESGGRDEPCNHCRMCLAIAEGRALDVIEIDAASNRGIDEIRDLRDRAAYAPSEARRKVYIIDEAHMLTNAAANAFLKTLEEPPPSTVFILATTEPHLLPATITSRCQRFDFRRVPPDAATGRLAHICREDGIDAPLEALELIVKAAEGSLRDAQNLLDQIVSFHGKSLTADKVREGLGLVADDRVPLLARQIVDRNVRAALQTVHDAIEGGVDLRQLRKELIEFLRGAMLAQFGIGEADAEAFVANPDDLVRILKRLNQADMRGDQLVALPLELAIVEISLGLGEAPADSGTREAPAARSARPAPAAAPPSRSDARPAPPSTPPATAPTPPPAAARELRTETQLSSVQERIERMMRDAKPAVPAVPVEPPAEPVVPVADLSPATAPPVEPAPATPAQNASFEQTAPPADDPDGGPAFSPPVAGGLATTETLRAEWPNVLRHLREVDRRIEGLLRDCEPMSIQGDLATLGFYYDYHKGKIADPRYRRTVEDVISKVLGVRLQVRTVLTARDKQGRIKRVLEDTVVRTALEELGAKLVDVE